MPSFLQRFRRRQHDPHPSDILKRKVFGRLSLWTAILLISLLAIPFLLKGLGWVLTTKPVAEFLKGRTRGLLASALHSRVEFGSLDTDLLTHLEARDIELFSLDPPGTEPYVRLDLLRLNYPTLPILTGRWIIRRIHLGHLQVVLHRDLAGRWHIPILGGKSSPTKSGPAVKTQGFRIGVRRFEVDQIEVKVQDDLRHHEAFLDCRGGKLKHNLTDWVLEADVVSLRANGQTLIEAKGDLPNTLHARWSPWQTRLEKSHLLFLGGTLDVEGVMSRDGTFKDTSLVIQGADLSRVGRMLRLPDAPFQGRLDASIRLAGNLERPDRMSSSGSLLLQPQGPSNEESTPISMRWTLAHGTLDAEFEESDNDILLKASVDAKGALKGLLTASLASLPTLTALAGWNGDLSGNLAATGDITGLWRRPRLDLQLDGTSIRLLEFPLDKVDGHILWDARGIRFDQVQVVGTERAFHADRPPFGLKGLSGGVSYRLVLDGPLSDVTAHLDAEFKRPGWGPLKFDRGALKAVYEDHVARLDFFKGQRDFTLMQVQAQHDLRKGTGGLDLVTVEWKGATQRGKDFAVALPGKNAEEGDHILAAWVHKKDGAFDAEAHCSDFDLARFNNLSPTSRRIAGKLTTALTLKRSSAKRPLKVTGKASLQDGLYQAQYDTAAITGFQSQVEWVGSRFTFHEMKGVIRNIPFEFKGYAALPQTEAPWDLRLAASGREVLSVQGTAGPNRVDLTATLDALPAPLAEPFLTFFRDMGGSFSGLIHLTGTFREPSFHGPFTTSQFITFLPVLNARLSGADLKATLNDKRVVLSPSPLRFNDGPLTLRGATAWGPSGLEEFDFRGDFSKAKVDLPRLMKGTLKKGWFNWAKHGDGYLLSADVDLFEGRWLKDFHASDPDYVPTYADFLMRTRFSVHFRGAKDLWLDNNFAKLRIDADASLTGSWAFPTLLGTFTALEGDVHYLDRKFDVQEASAVFNDATVINPLLNLQAATTMRSYSPSGAPQPYAIHFSITGTLDQMVYGLSSEPTLTQADIVSLITLGATQQEMITRNPTTGTSTGDVLLNRAGSLTAQTLTDYSTRKVGRWIGLEDLSMEGDAFGLGGSSGDGARISATTRVTDRVNVTYRTNTGADPQRSVRIGYYLSNNFSVVTEGNQAGETSMDLKYRLLFR